MKSLICSLLLLASSFGLEAQTYPIPQNLGGPTTLVQNPNYGGFKGGLIPYTFADTTAANTALTYLKNYNGAVIATTSPIALWYRDLTNTVWLQLSVSGSPTVNAWLTRGNDLSTQSLPNRLGTKNGDLLNIITSDQIRAIIPAGGIVRSSSAQNRFLMQDTVGKEIYYGDANLGAWGLTGNAGTVAGTNFVGTTDNIDLVFKRNSVVGLTLKSGYLDVTANMAFPNTSNSSTGVILKGSNRFIHNFKLAGTDGENTFVGDLSGNFSMTGSSGIQGSYNTGFGGATLFSNTTGFRNAAFGTYALQNNTTGFSNNAFGQAALFYNTTGFNNSAFGTRALTFNTTGTSNSAFGTDALFANTSGKFNAAFCIDALYQNTTGSYNSAFGDSTFWIGTVGIKNVGIGSRAGYYLGDVDSNYASVKDSMVTFLGADASRDNSISYNTALKNLTVIGYNAKGTASNQVTIGNSSVTQFVFYGALMPNNLPGTSGQILASAGANTSPTWIDQSTMPFVPMNSSGNAIAGNVIHTTTNRSSDFEAASGNAYVLADPGFNNFTITLPGSPVDGDFIKIYLPLTPGAGSWSTNVNYTKPDGTTAATIGGSTTYELQWDDANGVWRATLHL